ncbi:MAG: hypothetical protein Athens041674_692 [Parcubacteria group bacterium Athens0416_74]|nr:MAG: hypothetical protein Athens041674_692 [Parcubacteria group bacterium Athens0416_74]
MAPTVFMNRYVYVALAITLLSYALHFSEAIEGSVIIAPLVFALKVGFLIAAFRSSTKMNIYGKIVTWLLVVLTIPTLLLSLIVFIAPFVSFS